MDKCKREKDKLYEYASMVSQNYFVQNESDTDSYFFKREECSYIREYGFESVQELKEELNHMWDQDEIMQQCIQTISIAAIKMKPNEEIEDESKDTKNIKEKLPSYIYNM